MGIYISFNLKFGGKLQKMDEILHFYPLNQEYKHLFDLGKNNPDSQDSEVFP